MKLRQYQRLRRLDKSNIDAVAAMVCEVFNLSIKKVNNMQPKQFEKYCKKLEQKEILIKPLLRFKRFTTVAKDITFGQFIEVSEWLKNKPDTVDVAHLVGASILNRKGNHIDKCNKVLNMNAASVLTDVLKFIDSYSELVESYKWLFESDSEEKPHAFIKKFGWIFSAKEVANHHGIKLDEAYDLNVIEALNALAYIKGRGIYDDYLAKKK